MSEPVGFEDRLSIATPEGVELELTLAGHRLALHRRRRSTS